MTLSKPLRTVGLLGGGVIGGGWAARFVLNGIDVKIYDVDPQAERKIGEVMANARRAYAKLNHYRVVEQALGDQVFNHTR